jgi:hypothetical protein
MSEYQFYALLPLREDILKGDLRVLYLAWLASGFTEDLGLEPEEMIEPPVPANLSELSPALQAFADLFQIDPDLISAAALESPTVKATAEPIADWIVMLPESERNAYLVRVAQGETHVGAELIQRLRQKFGQGSPAQSGLPGRTLAQLIAISHEQRKIREDKTRQAADQARQKYLQQIAPRADAIWEETLRLIELKQSKPYDEAVQHLIDLRDLAIKQGNLVAFQTRMAQIQERYSNRSALLARLRKAKLLT